MYKKHLLLYLLIFVTVSYSHSLLILVHRAITISKCWNKD